MIGDAVILLVGRFMLLIDDDQGEIVEGKKECRARPGDDFYLALRDPGPDAGAFARADARMPFGGTRAKACRETVEELRRQRNLRHQDQALSPLAQSLRDGLEINLGLAGAGDAFEERDGEAVRFDVIDKCRGGLGLRRLKSWWREIRIARGCNRFLRQRDGFQRPFIDE